MRKYRHVWDKEYMCVYWSILLNIYGLIYAENGLPDVAIDLCRIYVVSVFVYVSNICKVYQLNSITL